MNPKKLAELRHYIKDNNIKNVEVRSTGAIRIRFYLDGVQRNETLKGIEATKANIKVAARKLATVEHEIALGVFDYLAHFPKSATARKIAESSAIPADPLFGDQLTRWLAVKASGCVAASTLRGYTNKAECHVRPRWSDRRLSTIKRSEVEHWLRVELAHLSNKTINDIMTPFRGVMGDAFMDEVIARNVADTLPNLQIVSAEPDPFTQTELTRLFTAETDRVVEVLCFELACWTGLSVSELLGLAVEDINLDRNEVTVRRSNVNGEYKIPKEQSRERIIEMLAPAAWTARRLLAALAGTGKDTINVVQWDNKTVRQENITLVLRSNRTGRPLKSDLQYREKFFVTHCKRAGVRYRGPNFARHTFISQLLTMGVAKEWIAIQAGHTTTKMIDQHYGKWITDDAPQMAALVSQQMGFSVRTRPQQDQRLCRELKNRYESTV